MASTLSRIIATGKACLANLGELFDKEIIFNLLEILLLRQGLYQFTACGRASFFKAG